MNALQSGVRLGKGFEVQRTIDTGRSTVAFVATDYIGGGGSDVLAFLQRSVDGAPDGSTAQSFKASPGKILRLSSIGISLRSGATAPTAGIISVTGRWSSTGPVTTISPTFAIFEGPIPAVNSGLIWGSWPITEGFEIKGNTQFGLSVLAQTNSPGWGLFVWGYEY